MYMREKIIKFFIFPFFAVVFLLFMHIFFIKEYPYYNRQANIMIYSIIIILAIFLIALYMCKNIFAYKKCTPVKLFLTSVVFTMMFDFAALTYINDRLYIVFGVPTILFAAGLLVVKTHADKETFGMFKYLWTFVFCLNLLPFIIKKCQVGVFYGPDTFLNRLVFNFESFSGKYTHLIMPIVTILAIIQKWNKHLTRFFNQLKYPTIVLISMILAFGLFYVWCSLSDSNKLVSPCIFLCFFICYMIVFYLNVYVIILINNLIIRRKKIMDFTLKVIKKIRHWISEKRLNKR